MGNVAILKLSDCFVLMYSKKYNCISKLVSVMIIRIMEVLLHP